MRARNSLSLALLKLGESGLGPFQLAGLLGSQRALPQSAEAAGYRFRYPELGAALRDVVG